MVKKHHLRGRIKAEGFSHDSVGKESACNAGDLGSIPGSGRYPGEGNGNPLQYFLPGKSIPWIEEPGGHAVHAKSQERLSD